MYSLPSTYLNYLGKTIGLDFREMFGILLLKVKCIYESFFDGTIRLRQKFFFLHFTFRNILQLLIWTLNGKILSEI